ncbi:MAG TPA: NnrS family protein [Dehalococcoidia bacterium]|nr:NnrS family protein [Dehalococcoidia bacterium]
MSRLAALFLSEDRQYFPFIAAALFFGVVVGFPLGLTLAHAAAQDSNLGGRWQPLVQAHGHLQLFGWIGMFVMGMGYRLVPRFTGVRVRPRALVPLTLVLMASGLALRGLAQPFADESPLAAVFVASAALEAAGTLVFSGVVLRCLATGRREAFLYSPFFAAGAVWAAVAALLGLVFVIAAARDSATTLPALRASALTFVGLYGFVVMFVLAVSMRTFPIFFERRPARPLPTLAAWALANGGIAAYAAAFIWKSYDHSVDVRLLQTAGFLAAGVALLALLVLLRIFEGQPVRLRTSARRSMRFVRSAYFWLLVAAALEVYFSLRALADELPPTHFQTDAVRHFIAVGFATAMIVGMALLVVPRLAMRRAQARPARLIAPVLLVLVHGATAARGAGSLLADETRLEAGYWTMSVGGMAAVVAMVVFAVYLMWPVRPPEIPVAARPE